MVAAMHNISSLQLSVCKHCDLFLRTAPENVKKIVIREGNRVGASVNTTAECTDEHMGTLRDCEP